MYNLSAAEWPTHQSREQEKVGQHVGQQEEEEGHHRPTLNVECELEVLQQSVIGLLGGVTGHGS